MPEPRCCSEPLDPNERFRDRRRQSRRRRSIRRVLVLAVVAIAAAVSALGMTFLNGWGGKQADGRAAGRRPRREHDHRGAEARARSAARRRSAAST